MANKQQAKAPHCSTQDPGGGVGFRSEGWSWVGLGVGLGIRGWSWVGLGLCKVGGVGSGSDSSLWISCSAVRTISRLLEDQLESFVQLPLGGIMHQSYTNV